MRFAQAEQNVIDCKSQVDKMEAQMKLAFKERDFFQERIKMLTDEKKKVQVFIDQKVRFIFSLYFLTLLNIF